MPRRMIVWHDYSYRLCVSLGGMPGRQAGRSRGNPYGRAARFRERGLSCKGRFGDPCKGTAKEVSPPRHLFAGGSLGRGHLGRPLPHGMGMLQHHEQAGKSSLAPARAGKPRHVPYRYGRGRWGKPLGLGPRGRCLSKPPQGSRHDPQPRDPGTTHAQPLHCPASPAALCHPPSKPCQGVPPAAGGWPPPQGLHYHPVVPQKQILVFLKGRCPPSTQGSIFPTAGPGFLSQTTGTRSLPRLPADPPDYFSWQTMTPSKLLNH